MSYESGVSWAGIAWKHRLLKSVPVVNLNIPCYRNRDAKGYGYRFEQFVIKECVMSVRTMSLVFDADFTNAFPKGESSQENTTRVSTAKFVCIALADHCNDEGKGAYPSIERLERKTSLSRRTVQYALDVLRDAGIITLEGKSEYGTNSYSLNLPKLTELAKKEPPIYGGASDASLSHGVQVMHPRGASDDRKDASLAHEPSFKPSINHGESSKTELSRGRTAEELKAQTLASLERFNQRVEKGGADFSWLEEGLVHFAETFVREVGVEYAPMKSERTLWRKVLREWQAIGLTDDIIERTVAKMRRDNLTIGSPTSVTKVARDMLAKVNMLGNADDLPPVFHATDEQIKEYKRSFGDF